MSTITVADSDVSVASFEVFTPLSNQLTLSYLEIASLGLLFWFRDTKYAICKTCKELVSQGDKTTKLYKTTNLVAHLKANHTDEYAKFTELKTKQDGERELVKKDKPEL